MHVFILRWCPSFSDVNETIVGQHEIIERMIRKDPICITGRRYGYTIPFASEFKLMEYRVKKEAVPDFLEKLQATSLVPIKNKITIWHFILPKKALKWFKLDYPLPFTADNQVASLGGKGLKIAYLLGKLSDWGIWLQRADRSGRKQKPYNEVGWVYNFCLGVMPDIEFNVSLEEGKEIKYESL